MICIPRKEEVRFLTLYNNCINTGVLFRRAKSVTPYIKGLSSRFLSDESIFVIWNAAFKSRTPTLFGLNLQSLRKEERFSPVTLFFVRSSGFWQRLLKFPFTYVSFALLDGSFGKSNSKQTLT